MAGLGCAQAVLLLAATANAQSPTAPSPSMGGKDANGIEKLNGELILSDLAISVGKPGNGGLSWRYIAVRDVDALGGTIGSLPSTEAINGYSYTLTLGEEVSIFERSTSTAFEGKVNVAGKTLTLNPATGIYTLALADGSVAKFATAYRDTASSRVNVARIVSLEKPDGEYLDYTYTSCGSGCYALQSVQNNYGYMVKYTYAPGPAYTGNLALVKVTALNLAVDACSAYSNDCQYSVTWPSISFSGVTNGTGQFSAQDSVGRVSTYTLKRDPESKEDRVVRIVNPSGVYRDFVFYPAAGLMADSNNGRHVKTVSSAAGVWTYDYPGNGVAVTKKPDGTSYTNFRSNLHGALGYYKDEFGVMSSYFFVADENLPWHIIHPDQRTETITYDARGNTREHVATSSNTADAAVTKTYGYPETCADPGITAKNCNRMLYAVDGENNRTDYLYDGTHGGLLRVTGPADAQGRRSQIRHTYAPFYARYKNDSGALVQDTRPIYKLIRSSSCINGPAAAFDTVAAASCEGTADELRTTYAYGEASTIQGAPSTASNIQQTTVSRSAGGAAGGEVVATRYDAVGNEIAVDGPLPGPADTTRRYYDAMRQLTGEIWPDPDGTGTALHRARRTTYRGDGQVTLSEVGVAGSQADDGMASFSPRFFTRRSYDANGWLVKIEEGQP
jgi:hypothetical protein